MKKYNGLKYCVELFDGLNALCDAMSQRTRCEGAGRSSETGDYDFTKTESYGQADQLARTGDKENAAKVQKRISSIRREGFQREYQPTSRVTRAVVGSRPCVPAAIIGNPLSMYRRKTIYQPKKVINVFYVVTTSAGIKTSEMIETGAKVTEAIRAVERSGVRINLYVGDVAHCGSERSGFFVKVKDSSRDMDVTRMAYSLIHPSFLRRHGFRWTETCKEITASMWNNGGYGRPISEGSEMKEVVEYMNSNGWNVGSMITFYSERNASVEQIIEHIMKP